MNENPYLIPEDGFNRTINFSGGRSSAYMLTKMVEAHGGKVPDGVAVCFCNTGKEREETLIFVKQVQEHLGIDVVWLEYDYNKTAAGGRKDPKVIHRKVSFETASRDGEPFETLTEVAKILPNQSMRKCTVELKIETTRRYCLRELGWKRSETKRVVGYRHDEPLRWGPALTGDNVCDLEFPMVYAGVADHDIQQFWSHAPFDLGLPHGVSNCDGCFLKGKGTLVRAFRAEPWRADWWIGLEKKRNARFSKRFTYDELRDIALNSPELPFEDKPAAVDESIHCFCTD